MVKVRLVLGRLLMVWGVVSLVVVLLLSGKIVTMLHRMMPPGNGPSIDNAWPSDVEYVMNWGEIGGEKNIERVVHSYQSGRLSLDGDHLNAFCIQVKSFPDNVESRPEPATKWMRGPVENPILADALNLGCNDAANSKLAWIPAEDVVNSKRCLLLFNRVELFDGWRVEFVSLSIYDTEAKLLYYVESKI